MSGVIAGWLRRDGWIAPLELALVVAIALVAARWTWLVLAPPPVAASGHVADAGERPLAVSVKRGLFGSVQEAAPERHGHAPRLRLVGVIAPDPVRGGWVVLAFENGRSRAFGVGDAVAPGVTVREIGPEYAVLDRDGVRERLVLAGRRATDSNGDARR